MYTSDGHDQDAHPDSIFHTPAGRMCLVAVLLEKLGGSVTITQDEINNVAYEGLKEESDYDSKMTLTLVRKAHDA